MAAERAELEKEREALKEVTASRDALGGQLEDKGRESEEKTGASLGQVHNRCGL